MTILLLGIGFSTSLTSSPPPNGSSISDPTLGEITMFGGNYAPRGWAFCNGQLLPISQYSALFSILGTTYGGDGRTTFALPDLRGRVPVHVGGSSGSGPGLSNYQLGQRGGAESVTLTVNEMPSHNHGANMKLRGSTGTADLSTPENNYPGGVRVYSNDQGGLVDMAADAIGGTTSNTGGDQPHENRPPYGTVNYIIALQGMYPSRD